MIPGLSPKMLLACAAVAALALASPQQQTLPPPAARPGPEPGPDSKVQPGTPTGEVIKGEVADFPDTHLSIIIDEVYIAQNSR